MALSGEDTAGEVLGCQRGKGVEVAGGILARHMRLVVWRNDIRC